MLCFYQQQPIHPAGVAMLLLAMLFGVSLRRLVRVPSGVSRVTPRRMSVVCRLLVASGLVMLGRFAVMASGMRQMF
jgi:hypothetical protein